MAQTTPRATDGDPPKAVISLPDAAYHRIVKYVNLKPRETINSDLYLKPFIKWFFA